MKFQRGLYTIGVTLLLQLIKKHVPEPYLGTLLAEWDVLREKTPVTVLNRDEG